MSWYLNGANDCHRFYRWKLHWELLNLWNILDMHSWNSIFSDSSVKKNLNIFLIENVSSISIVVINRNNTHNNIVCALMTFVVIIVMTLWFASITNMAMCTRNVYSIPLFLWATLRKCYATTIHASTLNISYYHRMYAMHYIYETISTWRMCFRKFAK